ncbi:protein cholesin isoform X4 [Macaca nemestrina]|uniref:protein cholesin isoform X4 n=2 Tax=Cercopithecinae TaxID=9528 RepID=UPI0039B8EA66
MTKVHRAGGDKCRGEDENRGFESGEEAEGGVRHQNIPCRATAGSPVWLRPIWEQRKRRMAKQKRKVPEVTEKKNKKLKKASAEGPLLGPEAVPSVDGASSKGGAVLRPVPDAELELSPEEQRVLERKLKKERKKEERQRLREAGLAAQHPPARRSGAELALDYLCAWAQKHKNWRFQKTRQTWLLLHMYDRDKVPDEHFSTMLAYLEGLQGRARELTVQKAEALMRELDEEDPDPLLPGRVQRIRQVLQLLS